MANGNAVQIGQKAFILSSEGEVVRTQVGKLRKDGYDFLNGNDSRDRHWFSFQEVLLAAEARIKESQTALRRTLPYA